MPYRVAASFALIAFAMCLLIGLEMENSFSTTVLRALVAMAGTFVIGLVLGLTLRKMVEENVKAEGEKLRNSGTKVETGGR
jgi:NhaP-type Na+/H+ or K+/H+ antiporter